MNLTPDALLVGPLVIGWSRLALVLGVMVFLIVVGRQHNPKLEQAAWWAVVAGVVTGRLAYVGFNWGELSSGGLSELLRATVDIRSGGFHWPLAMGVGILVLLGRLRAETLKLAPAVLLGAVAVIVPLSLRPVQVTSTKIDPQTELTRLEPSGTLVNLKWADLPKPIVLNFWATWCPPCRSEMPLLAEYIRKGYAIALINDGEDQKVVDSYLKKYKLEVPVYQVANLQDELGVTGLPTSIKIEADGQVSTRHLGALNRAELKALLEAQ